MKKSIIVGILVAVSFAEILKNSVQNNNEEVRVSEDEITRLRNSADVIRE